MSLSSLYQVDLIQVGLSANVTQAFSSSVDMAGFDGVMFLGSIAFQDGTAGCDMTAQGSNDDTTFQNLTPQGRVVGPIGSSEHFMFMDLMLPQVRYVRIHLLRATGSGNTLWGGTLAFRYKSAKEGVNITTLAGTSTLGAKALFTGSGI